MPKPHIREITRLNCADNRIPCACNYSKKAKLLGSTWMTT